MIINQLDLFSTPVMVIDNFISEEQREDILEKIKKLKHDNYDILGKNGYGTYDYQYHNNFLDNSIICEIEKVSNHYAKIREIGSVKLNSYWSVIQKKGSILKLHSHPEFLISGVLYVNVDDKSSKLYFENPNPYCHFEISKKNNKYNANRFSVEPKNCRLVLFPSWLQHSSDGIENNSDFRVCVSFNVSFNNDK